MNKLQIVTPRTIEKNFLILNKGEVLRNKIIRMFMFEPYKDLKANRKLSRNLNCAFEFNDIDLMKTIEFKNFFKDLNTNAVSGMYVPHSKEEFNLVRFEVNKYSKNASEKIRGFFHRNFGVRPYWLSEYSLNGFEYSELCLVPTKPEMLDEFKNHPQFSVRNWEVLKSRTERVMKHVRKQEKKLGTFRKELQQVLKKFDEVD
jgi:hypothetical protein